tara:strand:- start:371 stop:823 length:453 start_codon:yes stop_codon:yes gene_type:complete
MLDHFAIVYGFVSLFTGAFFLSNLLQFQKYWQARSKEYNQATTFLSGDSCQNPILRAHLGSFNKCEDAEEILGRMPVITALHDVATDLSVCGHGRCEILYMDVTQNLHRIVIGLSLLAAMGIWVSVKVCKERREERMMDYYALPNTKKLQ